MAKLKRVRKRLHHWERLTKNRNNGIKPNLLKLEDLLGAERDEHNLVELIDTNILANLEINKEKAYWEERASIN